MEKKCALWSETTNKLSSEIEIIRIPKHNWDFFCRALIDSMTLKVDSAVVDSPNRSCPH